MLRSLSALRKTSTIVAVVGRGWSFALALGFVLLIAGCPGALERNSAPDAKHTRSTPADGGGPKGNALDRAPDSPTFDLRAVLDQGVAGRDAAGPSGKRFGGELLGANLVAEDRVAFSLFAPRARSVAVLGTFNDWNPSVHPLVPNPATGIFSGTFAVPQAVGQHYRFLVDGVRKVADPYSKANEGLGDAVIIDPRFPWADQSFVRPKRSGLVIYELHLGDFTADPSSGVDAAQRGRYSGFLQKIPYLQRLGVNAVELMPIAENQSEGYSWGYNPALFSAPESSLAQKTEGRQVAAFQQVVDRLHQAGIAVVVDVVFNHISGKGPSNPLWEIDPLYYFDYDDNGDPENDKTPWGYRLANWRPMVQKLIYDSLKAWMDHYHVDGFRFDSTENMHADALIEVIAALKAQGYGERYFIFEEFSADHNRRLQQLNRAQGEALISSWGTGYKGAIWSALDGSGTGSLGPITYYSRDAGWTHPPAVINYFSSHDEGTLAGRRSASKQEVKVAATHLLTSLGVPMIWSGDEFLRAHYGNYHPAGDRAHLEQKNNMVDWTKLTENGDLVDYYSALIRLRIAHPALRLGTLEDAGAHFGWSKPVNWKNAIGYLFHGVKGDHDFVVLINYSTSEQSFEVFFPQPGLWHVMSDGQRATSALPGLATLDAGIDSTTKVPVGPQSGMVLMSAAQNP